MANFRLPKTAKYVNFRLTNKTLFCSFETSYSAQIKISAGNESKDTTDHLPELAFHDFPNTVSVNSCLANAPTTPKPIYRSSEGELPNLGHAGRNYFLQSVTIGFVSQSS
jgi:hypothetical protein